MFNQLFSVSNLFRAWRKFRSGKARKKDVIFFEYHVEDNTLLLHDTIASHTYIHHPYEHFQVFDNKKRDIYKAHVCDRIVHQILYDYLVSLYEPIFISDSYSSRDLKGHHKAVTTLRYFIKLASNGNTIPVFTLKCDIKKYFDTIDHVILLEVIKEKIKDPQIFSIIEQIVISFRSKKSEKKGIPLGNITSQIFANIYLHPFDLYIKKELRCRFYIRYNDDFIILSNSYKELEEIRNRVIYFIQTALALTIPLEKTSIRKVSWGIDFLGYVVMPHCVLLRNKTKAKMFRSAAQKNKHSYLGILQHCNSFQLRQKLLSIIDI